MHYLIGYTGGIKGEEVQFNSELNLLLKPSATKITEAHSLNSLLSYLAVDHYDAIWVRWSLLERYYLIFHDKLEVLKKKIPLIILYGYNQIPGELCLKNDMVFSLIRENAMEEIIPSTVERIRHFNQFKQEYDSSISNDIRPNGYRRFVGNNDSMLNLYSQIIKVSKTDFSVLILGESGSGKEVVAKTIHQISKRSKYPFVSLNCAAIPENLLESELFGYEKGAFTGAQKSKEGKFELANNGTIFLDEIGDLALTLQGKLLRVLEDHTIEKLGSTATTKVNIRLITATNKNLNQLSDEGNFRSDLYHRINVIPMILTPIRERGEDITLLILHLISNLTKDNELKVKSVSSDLIDRIKSFPLDGNVRELENIITRLIFYSDSRELNTCDLNEATKINFKEPDVEIFQELESNNEIIPLKDLEKKAIMNALNKLDKHITNVANALKISRGTLYNKMKEYDIS